MNEVARPLVKRLFDFLEAFDQKKNPVVTSITSYDMRWSWQDLPNSSYVEVAALLDPLPDGSSTPSDEEDFILRVSRPEIPEPPGPPSDLLSWLSGAWSDATRTVTWAKERTDADLGVVVLTESDEERLSERKATWEIWAEEVRPSYKAGQLFKWLWDVHTTLERESERFELAIGDGNLVWENAGIPADHPLLIQRLQLDFDASKPAFTVLDADSPPEFQSGVLRALNINPLVISRLLETANTERPHPLWANAADEFLTVCAGEIHSGGSFIGMAPKPAVRANPQIYRSPMLFLRRRSLGFEAAIRAIKTNLEEGGDIPDSLAALVGVHEKVGTSGTSVVDPFVQGDEAEDVLLTKEANREQLEIAQRLGKYGAVQVQGPPGTGKTHTIANLIGHLLATGQSVLVTSHTTKALRVLREKVVPQLQPLCVSVLEGDAEGNSQLQTAVTEIGRRLGSTSVEQLEREAETFREHRHRTLTNIESLRTSLLSIVKSEYSAVVHDGQEYSPIEAARLVHDGEADDAWIPGSVIYGTSLSLTSTEVGRLYQLNASLTDVDISRASGRLPEPEQLLTPMEFRELVERRRRLAPQAVENRDVWVQAARSESDVQSLGVAISEAFSDLDRKPSWYRHALEASLVGDGEDTPWLLLRDDIESYHGALREARLTSAVFAPSLPVRPDLVGTATTLDAIISRLRTGKGLTSFGIMNGEWRRLINGSTVLGQTPSTIEHFEALRRLVGPELVRGRLEVRWRGIMGPFGIEMPTAATAEQFLAPLLTDLSFALDEMGGRITNANEIAERLGFSIGKFLPERDLDPAPWWMECAVKVRDLLPQVLASEIARLRITAVERRLRQVNTYLVQYAGDGGLCDELGTATRTADPVTYGLTFEALVRAIGLRGDVAERQQLLERLSKVAEAWAEAVRNRIAPHSEASPPGDVLRAWRWKQLVYVLNQRSEGDVGAVINQIAYQRRVLRDQTSDLIDRLAWAAQGRKTDHATNQALRGYVEIVRRIGRGTGRRAPAFRAEARRLMADSRSAVPVWIAPLSRVAETFDARKSKFDVVIIDEASQSDVMALLTWFMARTVIVVGDDQQVTPSAVGQNVDDMQSMIDAFLQGVPNRMLYDGQASIYQLASTAFEGIVRLREHFRCVPEIISFSNLLSYNGEIVPLRDLRSARIRPPVISHRVVTGVSNDRNTNEVEAREIASLLVACLEQPEYDGLTFGVISLLGQYQSPRIEQILRNVISPTDYQARRILCGEPPHFQGDERDVVFLSLVDSPPDVPPLSLRGGPGEQFKKRYNVATSRARDQLWVVHSLDKSRNLKTADLRWRLLDWAANPTAVEQLQAAAALHAQSPFEVDVLNRLIDRGYKVTPQYEVGAYRIDIVVEDGDKRLAVECDGEAFHSSDEQIRADLERQALLERMGLQFHRIRGSAFYRDPEKAIAGLVASLDALDIFPQGNAAAETTPATRWSELHERILARAAQLREEWSESFAVGSGAPVGRSSGRPRGFAASRVSRYGSFTAPPVTSTVSQLGIDAPGDPAVLVDQQVATDADDTEPSVVEPSSAIAVTTEPVKTPTSIEPYGAWEPRAVPDLDLASPSELQDAIVDIVSAEGPIAGRRLYQLVVKASGGQRVAKTARSALNKATYGALSSGRLEATGLGHDSAMIDAVWRLKGTPAVRVRTRGDRELEEIPEPEISGLAAILISVKPHLDRDALKREILDTYGLVRMTPGVNDFLEGCIAPLLR